MAELDLVSIRRSLDACDGISLRPPATERAVAAFEADLAIALPTDFRTFLLEVCEGVEVDGEPLLYSMQAMLEDLAPARGRAETRRDVTRPFPYDDADAEALRRAIASRSGATLMECRAFMELQKSDRYEGCLTVASNGGNDFTALVVTGAQRGTMWRTGEIDHPELVSTYDGSGDFATPLGFLAWFVRWAPAAFGARFVSTLRR